MIARCPDRSGESNDLRLSSPKPPIGRRAAPDRSCLVQVINLELLEAPAWTLSESRDPVYNDQEAAALFRRVMGNPPVEELQALYLDTKSRPIAVRLVARGSLNAMHVNPRDVYLAAVALNAAGVVLCHNHPSGDPTPSTEDVAFTLSMKRAGELLGIPLYDHIVLGARNHRCIRPDA